jgi:hypothetical protein
MASALDLIAPSRPRRARGTRAVLACGLAILAALAGAARADARFVLGIGDQSAAMLADPRFDALGLRDTRIVLPYNVATDPAQLARYAPVLDAAHARGMRVLVAFSRREDTPRRLPSVREYTAAVRAFRARFPWVRDVTTWNEANHSGQPTARHPGRTARLYNALRVACRGCRIVAADVLDQAGFQRWIRAFRRTARSPRIWGLHNYVDVNRDRDVSVPRMRAATAGRGTIWLTETGGVVRFARSFGYDERRAARSTRHVLRIAARRKVTRVYLYQWSGAPLGARWDSGLIAADGRARPALNVVERYLKKPPTPLPPIPRVPRFPRPADDPVDIGGAEAPPGPGAAPSAPGGSAGGAS